MSLRKVYIFKKSNLSIFIDDVEAGELTQARSEDFTCGNVFVDEFDWSTFEMTKLPIPIDIIIAADVVSSWKKNKNFALLTLFLTKVYDEDLTVSLVSTLKKLLSSKDNNGKVPIDMFIKQISLIFLFFFSIRSR